MNRLHSTGMKELVLDLKEEEYEIGVKREMAPIYTLGDLHNGYTGAKTHVIIYKPIYELLSDFDISKHHDLYFNNSYEVIRIGDYAFTGNVKIYHVGNAEHFSIICDKMLIAKYIRANISQSPC